MIGLGGYPSSGNFSVNRFNVPNQNTNLNNFVGNMGQNTNLRMQYDNISMYSNSSNPASTTGSLAAAAAAIERQSSSTNNNSVSTLMNPSFHKQQHQFNQQMLASLNNNNNNNNINTSNINSNLIGVINN